MAPKDERKSQAERDAEVEGALRAWRERDRGLPREEADRVWEAAWTALDFSWEGLADAGWERGEEANEAQRLKRWRAPADLPGDGNLHGEGAIAWRESTLQEYLRWSPAKTGELLTNSQLRASHLLIPDGENRLWHAVHTPELRALPGAPRAGDAV